MDGSNTNAMTTMASHTKTDKSLGLVEARDEHRDVRMITGYERR